MSTDDDVLEMSVVRGVGGVCEMCICLARGVLGGVGVSGLGLGFTNHAGTGGLWDVCLCCGSLGGVGGSGWLGPGSGRVVLCYVCVCCEFGFFVEMAGACVCVLCSADTCAS